MQASNRYGDSVVAFVDILGFSALVGAMDQEPSIVDDIHGIFAELTARETEAEFAGFLREGIARLTIASDSILFSISFKEFSQHYRDDPGWACLAAVETIHALQGYLLRRSILTRGGIVVGKVLHDEIAIFGPAVVEAYKLERSAAVYPRVIVDSEVREIILASKGFLFAMRANSLIKRDFDGLRFVDYLNYNPMRIERSDLLAAKWSSFQHSVEKSLVKSGDDPRIFQKVAWLASYFNDAIERWKNDSEVSEWHCAFDEINKIDLP